jgi:biotin operon repressor
MRVRPNSQNARILKTLSDGSFHSVANIHRKAGASRLNSRVSELRKYGYEIEKEQVAGKSGSLGFRYRLLNPPSVAELATIVDDLPVAISREEVPRDLSHRFRIYKMMYDELVLLATAPTAEDVGVEIVALGSDGQFAGGCLGLLDTHGTEEAKGSWTIQPWDTTP